MKRGGSKQEDNIGDNHRDGVSSRVWSSDLRLVQIMMGENTVDKVRGFSQKDELYNDTTCMVRLVQ